MTEQLEAYYHEVAEVAEEKVDSAQKRAKKLMEVLVPRMRNNKYDLTLSRDGVIYSGSTYDDTQVLSVDEVDILLPFDKLKCQVELLEPGYICVVIPRMKKQLPDQPDRYRFGRSKDNRMYLSPIVVCKTFHKMLEHALKYPIEIPNITLMPLFQSETDGPQISLMLKGRLQLNIIPTILQDGDKPDVITRAYLYDENPRSDMLWRYLHREKELKIMNTINTADKGLRKRAFKILKTIFLREKTLQGLSTYHLKTILYNSFESTVDSSPRWQRDDLETCFVCLLNHLAHYLAAKKMPDFFVEGFNLLDHMPTKIYSPLASRIRMVVSNPLEVARLLRRR